MAATVVMDIKVAGIDLDHRITPGRGRNRVTEIVIETVIVVIVNATIGTGLVRHGTRHCGGRSPRSTGTFRQPASRTLPQCSIKQCKHLDRFPLHC